MRAIAILTGKLERNLIAYATVAAATGAGVGTALTQTADAEVIYTPAHVVIILRTPYNLDLNHDGAADFLLEENAGCDYSDCYETLNVRPTGAGSFVSLGHGPNVPALPRGTRIGPKKRFGSFIGLMAGDAVTFPGYRTFPYGLWANVKNRYLGLRFNTKGSTHYGWARLSVNVQDHFTATVTGYAYETIPDKPIIAGFRGGPTQTGASLGHLALGTAGRKQNRHSQVAGH